MLKSTDRQGWILRWVYFLFFIQAGSWFSLFALFLERNGLTGLQSGIILAIIPAGMLVVMPFWGMVADKLGYKRTLLITVILTAFTYSLFLFRGNFWYYFVNTVIVSLVYNPSMNSLLDSIALEYADKHKNTNFGNFRIWGSIGFAAGGLIAGKIISVVAMKYIFVFASLLLFAGWILLFFIRTTKTNEKKAKEPVLKGLNSIFTNKNIVGFLILNTCVAISIQSVWAFYTVYLNKIGASNQILGVGIMLQALVELPFYPIAYYIIKKFGLIRAISISVFFTALRLFLYSGVSNPYLALPIECLQGLSYILNILAAIEYLNITIPVQWRATGQALFASTYFGVGAIVGNWWAGFLIDIYGIQKMFFINGLIISLTFVFSFFIENKIYENNQIQLSE